MKAADLCGRLPVKDSVGPVLMLLLRRFRNGVAPANSFEAAIHDFLLGLSSQRREALEVALDAYDSLPDPLRECLFETRFDTWDDREAIDPDFVGKAVIAELFGLGNWVRDKGGGAPRPGKVRDWEQTFLIPGGEPGASEKRTGPWPYICAVSPTGQTNRNETDWFRNESARRPGNSPPINYFPHEFARECSFIQDPPQSGGKIRLECVNVTPAASSGGGGFGFAECPGGVDYRATVPSGSGNQQACLKIPQTFPGSEVGLRGFNFFSFDATVRITKVDGSFRKFSVPINSLFGDMSPGTEVTCGVEDTIFFTFPGTIKDNKSNSLNKLVVPPGLYAVQVVVPLSKFAMEFNKGVQTVESNTVLIELLPRQDLRYTIRTDYAYCNEETDGLGSDEPWFQGLSALAILPKEADGIFDIPYSTPVTIFEADDVDSGEFISFQGVNLFDDTVAEKVLAVGLIGLEVDSEEAAREQIKDFWDAYFLYFKQFFVQLGANTDAGFLGDAVAASFRAGAISPWVYVTGGILLAIAAGGILFAIWAPADILAFDVMTYTSQSLFALTDKDASVLPQGGSLDLGGVQVSITPLKKDLVLGAQASVYHEMRQYRNPEENSRYELRFKTSRA